MYSRPPRDSISASLGPRPNPAWPKLLWMTCVRQQPMPRFRRLIPRRPAPCTAAAQPRSTQPSFALSCFTIWTRAMNPDSAVVRLSEEEIGGYLEFACHLAQLAGEAILPH